jgi:CNT family concentrative nucleoside transporter
MTLFLTLNLITIPLVIGLCKIMEPSAEHSEGSAESPYKFSGLLDAISKGTGDGLSIFLNIIAMMIVMAALIAIVNNIFGLIPADTPLTLQHIFGYAFSPIAWLMGIPWSESLQAGQLLGTKTVLNEIFAFIDLSKSAASFSPQSQIVLVSALASFANFSTIGITIAGVSALCPEKKDMMIQCYAKALLIGGFSTCMSGAVIGLIR